MVRKILLALVTFLVCGAAVELYARSQPLPRVQNVMKLDNHSLRVVNKVPVWVSQAPGAEAAANRDCVHHTDGQIDVLLVGDSIFYGVRLESEDRLAPLLQAKLAGALDRPVCVVNVAQPGYTFSNQEVVLSETIDTWPTRIVVLELWFNSINQFALLDGNAYNFGNLTVDEWGFPNPGISSQLNRFLFEHLTSWRHIAVGYTEKAPRRSIMWERFVTDKLEPLRQRLADQGIHLVLAYATALGTPFSEGRPKEDQTYAIAREWAAENQVPELLFAEVLAEESTAEIGIDSCCHLSGKGMRMVSDALAPILASTLSSTAP